MVHFLLGSNLVTYPVGRSVLFLSPLFIHENVQAATGKWEIFELTLTTTKSYSNEYTDVTLTTTYTAPTSNTIQMPGFWDGGQTWKVRMAPNEIGTWAYVTASNDGQLDNQSGQFERIASSKKGFIQVNPSDPYNSQGRITGGGVRSFTKSVRIDGEGGFTPLRPRG